MKLKAKKEKKIDKEKKKIEKEKNENVDKSVCLNGVDIDEAWDEFHDTNDGHMDGLDEICEDINTEMEMDYNYEVAMESSSCGQ